MFILQWVPEAAATYDRLRAKAEAVLRSRKTKGRRKSSRDEGLFKQVHKTITLLANNPRHPGLQTHEYTSINNPFAPSEKVFEAYAQQRTPSAYRVFWCYGPGRNEVTIIAITPHP